MRRDERRPGAVPDVGAPVGVPGVPVAGGMDTNGDGAPDTLVARDDDDDLLLLTDLDGDGLADQVLRIDEDATASTDPRPSGHPATEPPWWWPWWWPW